MDIKYRHIFSALFLLVAVAGLYEAVYGLVATSSLLGVSGHFANPAGFAAFLAVSLPFVLYFSRLPKRLCIVFSLVITGIIFSAIVLSCSRTGLLAALIVVIFFLWPRFVSLWGQWSRRSHVVILCTVGVLCVAGGMSLYRVKKDSADGRLLIWRNTVAMIADRPLFGYGSNGFGAKYMLYQARYFESNPECLEADLADNVNHPFNEYLFLIVRYGIVGFLGIVMPFSAFIFYLSRDRSRVHRTVRAFFVAIGVLACFSYPFYYPVVLILMLVATLLAIVEYYIRCERSYRFAVVSALWLAGCLVLLPYLMSDSRLYNVAVDLNREGRYAQSISVLEKYCQVSMDVEGS